MKVNILSISTKRGQSVGFLSQFLKKNAIEIENVFECCSISIFKNVISLCDRKDFCIVLCENSFYGQAKEVVCEFLGDELTINDFAQNYFFSKKVNLDLCKDTLLFPKKSRVIINKNGINCGFVAKNPNIIFLPNAEDELRPMFFEGAERILLDELNLSKTITFSLFGISGEKILQKVKDILPPCIELAFCENFPVCDLIISYKKSAPKDDVDDFLANAYEILKDYIFSTDNETLSQIIVEMLETQNKTLSIFEQCTKGELINIFLKENSLSELYITQSKIVPKIALTSNDFSDTIYKVALRELEEIKTDYVLGAFRENNNLNKFSIVVADKENVHIFNESYFDCDNDFESFVSQTALFYFLRKLKFIG